MLTPIALQGTTALVQEFSIVRLTPTGQLDTTFSGDGKVGYSFDATPWGSSSAVAQQSDGKLVVGGYTQLGDDLAPTRFGVMRLRTDGTLDTAFSDDGKQTVGFDRSAYLGGMAIQGDGKIVLAGHTDVGTDTGNRYDFAVARLTGGDGPPPAMVGRTSGGGWWINRTNLNGNAFVVSSAVNWNESLGWRDVASADVTGDGFADLVGRTATGMWYVSASNINGTFTAPQVWASWNEAAGWRDVHLADYDGDGRADVAGRTSGGEWWVGTSTGIAFSTTKWANWSEAAGWRDVMAGPFVG